MVIMTMIKESRTRHLHQVSVHVTQSHPHDAHIAVQVPPQSIRTPPRHRQVMSGRALRPPPWVPRYLNQ